jgi:putative transposase
VHGASYHAHRGAVADLFEYIDVFYIRSRRHSSLGFMSPTLLMQDWLAA